LNNGLLVLNSTSALGSSAVALSIGGGTLDLATDGSVTPYNTAITGNATILADRKTSGAGVTHQLGTLSISNNMTLTVDDSSAVTSGSPTLVFGALTLSGNGTI